MHLITVLRQLALGGRAVLTTIHQPSSRLYQQLDKLLLLAEGHAIYYGAADKVGALARICYCITNNMLPLLRTPCGSSWAEL